jgi:predicted RNase H-like HicB family nuclease
MATMKIDKRTYTLTIERHPDGYLAYFPALPGCNTWGKTHEEAVGYAEEALTLYLETLIAHNDPIPEEADSTEPVSLGVTVRTATIA